MKARSAPGSRCCFQGNNIDLRPSWFPGRGGSNRRIDAGAVFMSLPKTFIHRFKIRSFIMQFLAISRMRTDIYSDADFAPLREDEAQRARTLYIEGAVRQIWYRGDERGACSLLEADSEEAARALIGSLPLVQAGMLELVHLIPLLPYPGFGPRS
jgi:muconolactone delta-isomerase